MQGKPENKEDKISFQCGNADGDDEYLLTSVAVYREDDQDRRWSLAESELGRSLY